MHRRKTRPEAEEGEDSPVGMFPLVILSASAIITGVGGQRALSTIEV